jgi:hypothetical protein
MIRMYQNEKQDPYRKGLDQQHCLTALLGPRVNPKKAESDYLDINFLYKVKRTPGTCIYEQ